MTKIFGDMPSMLGDETTTPTMKACGLPDGYLWRKGDTIAVFADVTYDGDVGEDSVHGKVVGSYSGNIIIPKKSVAFLYSRKWKEREAVKTLDGRVGVVVSTFENMVWVKFEGSGLQTVNSLRLVPATMNESAREALLAAE